MSISMLITDKQFGNSIEIPICTYSTFQLYWLKAAKQAGLEMIEALGGLSLVSQHRDRFLSELNILKEWVKINYSSDTYCSQMIDTIDTIIKSIMSYPIEDYEFSFG